MLVLVLFCFVFSAVDPPLPLADWAEVVFLLSDWLIKLLLCIPGPVGETTVKHLGLICPVSHSVTGLFDIVTDESTCENHSISVRPL